MELAHTSSLANPQGVVLHSTSALTSAILTLTNSQPAPHASFTNLRQSLLEIWRYYEFYCVTFPACGAAKSVHVGRV